MAYGKCQPAALGFLDVSGEGNRPLYLCSCGRFFIETTTNPVSRSAIMVKRNKIVAAHIKGLDNPAALAQWAAYTRLIRSLVTIHSPNLHENIQYFFKTGQQNLHRRSGLSV
jgi:hypothetical protein